MFKRLMTAAVLGGLGYLGAQGLQLGDSSADLEEPNSPPVQMLKSPTASGNNHSPATGRSSQDRAGQMALAQALLHRAEQSADAGRLGPALLQYGQARALAPELAASAAVGVHLEALLQREAEVMKVGLQAATQRDQKAVTKAVSELRVLDKTSSAAMELALQANAALADHGGSFTRFPLFSSAPSNQTSLD